MSSQRSALKLPSEISDTIYHKFQTEIQYLKVMMFSLLQIILGSLFLSWMALKRDVSLISN
jgi:hypothetical protein